MEGKRAKGKGGGHSRAGRLAGVPFWARILLYYLALYLLFHYLLHSYAQDVLERQLVGTRDTLLLTLAIIVYVIFCALPPFIWSGSGVRRPLSRAVESFACYAAVVLLLNVLFRAIEDGGSGYLSGLTMGRPAWGKLLSTSALFLAFLAAAFMGARRASGKGKGRRR